MTIAEPVLIDVDATRILAACYGQAWNDHDLDAIMARHAPRSAFHLHVRPYLEANDHDSIRQQFAGFFVAFPDLAFATVRLEVRAGLFTHEWDLTGTLAAPLILGERVVEPAGQRIAVRGVDVISCEMGLIRRKDCFLDALALDQQLPG